MTRCAVCEGHDLEEYTMFNDRIPLCAEHEALAEKGRRLASERERLIAQGVNPAELLIPLHPLSPKSEEAR